MRAVKFFVFIFRVFKRRKTVAIQKHAHASTVGIENEFLQSRESFVRFQVVCKFMPECFKKRLGCVAVNVNDIVLVNKSVGVKKRTVEKLYAHVPARCRIQTADGAKQVLLGFALRFRFHAQGFVFAHRALFPASCGKLKGGIFKLFRILAFLASSCGISTYPIGKGACVPVKSHRRSQ